MILESRRLVIRVLSYHLSSLMFSDLSCKIRMFITILEFWRELKEIHLFSILTDV